MSENRINEVKKRMQWVGRHVPGGFFVYHANAPQDVIYANSKVFSLYGCANEEEFLALTGGTFKGMVHPEDYNEIEASIQSQIADSANDNFDAVVYRIVRKDGEIRWVDDYGMYEVLPDLGPVYYVFIGDITEKVRLQRENEQRAHVIGGLSVDYEAICLYNLRTGALIPFRMESSDYTPDADRLKELGSPAEGVNPAVKAYAEKFVLKEDRERYLTAMDPKTIREKLKAVSSYSVDYRCAHPDGSLDYYRLTVAAVSGFTNEEAVVGYCKVTDQVRKAMAEMAERMKMETDLEREKHANEVRNTFLFNMSHDLRTPLNAIMGYTDLARKHQQDPELLKKNLDRVDASNRELLLLIDDLLEMNRFGYGEVVFKEEPTPIGEQVEHALDLFRADAEAKKLHIEEDLELPGRTVMTDPASCRRIAAILLSNAVKFTPAGGKIKIRLEEIPAEVPDDRFVSYRLTVSDSGIGVSPAFMDKMFVPFEREESSTVSGEKGTGLGLAIAKNLVDVMHGTIKAESEKGKGTTVTVEMPFRLPEPGQTEIDSGHPAQEDVYIPARAAGDCRILLVEDIEINRMLAQTVLEEAGFSVDCAEDGKQALEAVKNHAPWYYDIVLMDIQMPVMNGYESARAIRELGREDTRLLPIVALSANARKEDRAMSFESGMNDHVAKPFDADNLIRIVNREIGEARKR